MDFIPIHPAEYRVCIVGNIANFKQVCIDRKRP